VPQAAFELGALARRQLSEAKLPRRARGGAAAAGFAPAFQHVVGHRERLQRNAEFLLGALELFGAQRLACALAVPALVGAPKPMVVLQAIIEGVLDFCARAIAAAIAC